MSLFLRILHFLPITVFAERSVFVFFVLKEVVERGKEGDKLERTERQRDVKAEEEEEEEGAESKDKDEISHHRFLASLNRLNPTNPLRIIVNGAGGSRFTTPPPPNLAQPLRSSLRQQPPPPRPQTPPPPILVPEEPQPQTPPPPGQHQTRSIFTPTPQVISFPFWHFSRKDFIFFFLELIHIWLVLKIWK